MHHSVLYSCTILGLMLTSTPILANSTDKVTPPHLAEQQQFKSNHNIADEPVGTLSLPQALAHALIKSPELVAYALESRAREAATLQASFFPNPTLGANAANFGNKVIRGFDGDVVTLELSQLIELGGKRAARTEAASLTKELADWDYETKRIDVLTQVSLAFIDVLTAQQRLELVQQTEHLARQTLETTAARVQAGKVSPVEETKAKTAHASVQIELMRAQRELDTARKQLASNWGSTTPRFQSVAGELNTVQVPPALNTLEKRLSNNPDLARWATEITQRQALISMEKSKAVPDVTATIGASKYLMPNDYALVVGFSVPLPVFNRNQGAILEAENRLSKAEEDRTTAEVKISTALNTAYQKLSTAYNEIIALRDDILPGATSAYNASSEGYRMGKFGFLDVLDAQRILFGAKNQYLQALSDYHKAVTEVERLIGSGLEDKQLLSAKGN
jgi:outer membrane protein, heavy metal efflux system